MITNLLATESTGTSWYAIVILAVFFVLMIVMTIVPQKKRQKQMQSMMDNLAPGDKVMTIGRLIGKIVAIDNDNKQVTLNVGTEDSETLIVIDRNAIGVVMESKNKPAEPVKEKKPNLGINSKKKDEDKVDLDEKPEEITLGNTEEISIESKEDISIDNNEDISIENKDEDVKF